MIPHPHVENLIIKRLNEVRLIVYNGSVRSTGDHSDDRNIDEAAKDNGGSS